MRIFNLSLPVFFLLIPLHATNAQKLKLSGSGKGYAGVEVKVYRLSDPITKSLVPLLRADCDSTGNFTFETDAKPGETMIFRTGIYYLHLYIDSSRNMVLKMPDYIAKSEEEQQDSYFAETKMVPEVMNDTSDINNLMWRFDQQYDRVFNRVADRVMYNTKKGDIPSLIASLNKLSVPGNTGFIKDFVRYRMIMLNQVAGGEYPGRKEDSLMVNSRFAPENPAYTDLLEQMFNKYFRDIASGRLKDSFNRAILASSVAGLKKVINLDGKASNGELTAYVIILNLFNEYFGSFIKRERVIEILKNLEDESSSQYIKELAGIIISKLTLLDTGSYPPPLKLKDEEGSWFSVQEHRGKFLLLSFARSDNAFSLSEYGLIKTWLPRFSGDLDVVTVLCDRDYEAGVRRMHSMGFRWKMLNGSSSDIDEYNYNITMFPSFILIDRDGKVAVKSCPFPSENFDRFFAKKIEGESR